MCHLAKSYNANDRQTRPEFDNRLIMDRIVVTPPVHYRHDPYQPATLNLLVQGLPAFNSRMSSKILAALVCCVLLVAEVNHAR